MPEITANGGHNGLRIVPMTAAHADQVLAIYQDGIDEGQATFEVKAPAWPEFDETKLPEHRLVALDADPGPAEERVLGWVAVSPTSRRPAYAGVVEHSVYVHRDARGRGVGRILLDALVESTERAGIWTIQSSIFPENEASLVLHRKAGFRVIGRRERVARHHGMWRDTIMLERRSQVTGDD